jgi:hypothetical protein
MNKKQLVIQILTRLKSYRNLADGLLTLVESSYVEKGTIDGLIMLISESLQTMKKGKEKTVIQKWLEKIQRIKHMEEEEKLWEGDADKLLLDI